MGSDHEAAVAALRATGDGLDARMATLMGQLAQAKRETPGVVALLDRHVASLGRVSTLVCDLRVEASTNGDPQRSRVLHEMADIFEAALGSPPGSIGHQGPFSVKQARERNDKRWRS